jgi:hypothetical protein
VFSNNAKVNSIYQNIMGDEPLIMSKTAQAMSKMVSELVIISSYIAAIILVGGIIWRFGNVGMDIMRKGEVSVELSDLWLLGAATLVWPYFDGISLAVLMLLGSILISIKSAAWLSSLFLPMILPESEVENGVLDLGYHQPRSEAIATNLVLGLSTAQDSSTYASALSVMPENATLIDGDASEAEGAIGSIWRFFARQERDPTYKEFYSGIFSDHSLALSVAGAKDGSNSSTNLELFSGKPTGKRGGIKAPLFIQDQGVDDVFEQSNVMSISSPEINLDRKVIQAIAKSPQIEKMAELLVAPNTSEKQLQRNAQLVGDALLALVKETKLAFPKAAPSQIIRVATGLLDGTYSIKATRGGISSFTYRFTPFAIPAQQGEPLFTLLRLANESVKAGRMVACVKNLDKAGTEIGAMYQIAKEGKSINDKFKSLSNAPFGHPVCIYPTSSGDVELLLSSDAKAKAFAIYQHSVSGGATAPLAVLLGDLKRELEQVGDKPEIVALTEDSQAHFKTLVDYFNVLGTSSRYAAAKYMGEADSEANKQADQELREKGAIGLLLSFMSSAHRSMAFADAIRASESKTNIFVGKEEQTGWMPRKVIETKADAQNAAIPTNKDLVSVLTGNAEQVARMSTKDESMTGSAWAEYLMQGMEYLIPDSDLLVDRLGLGDDGLAVGLAGCASSNTCINFSGHPVHAIVSFSNSMLEGGVIVLIIDSVIQNLNSYLQNMTGNGEDTDGVLEQAKAFALQVASNLAGPLKLITGFMFVVAMISAVLAKLALGGVFAGAIGAILMPLKVVFSAVAPVLKALTDLISLVALLPVLLAMSIIKFDREPIVSGLSVLKLTVAGLLTLPLITLSFVVFIVLSYVGVFLVNSIVGVATLSANGSGVITTAIAGVVSVVIWLAFVIYVIFKSLDIALTIVPKVQDMLGLNSALGQVKEDLNNVFAAGMILTKTQEVKERSSRITDNKIQKEKFEKQFEDMATQAGKGMGMGMNNQDVPEAEAAQAVTQEGSESAASQSVVETSTHKEVKEVTTEKANVDGEPESNQSEKGAAQKDESPSGEVKLPDPKDEPTNGDKI